MALESPSFQHYASAQSDFTPPLIANDNAFLDDVFSRDVPPCPLPLRARTIYHARSPRLPLFRSESLSHIVPIYAGFYRLASGPELVYTYIYDEMKIIVDDDFEISDETGKSVKAGKGDVFFLPKGSKITNRTENGELGWCCGQRKSIFLILFGWAGRNERIRAMCK